MHDYQAAVIKQRMSQYLRSRDFDPYFERLHHSARGLLAMGLIAPLTIVGFPVAMAAWKKLKSGDARTKSLRAQYSRLGEVGRVVFTFPVIANTSLLHKKGASAAALVAGNFNDRRDNIRIMHMIDALAAIALGDSHNPNTAALSKILSDQNYTFKRRRVIPPRFTGGIDLTLFDLQIISDYLPANLLQSPIFPCFAEPGPKGLIVMIPHSLVADIMPEIEESYLSGFQGLS